ncbi:hypothetical protein D3OALGA1CA_3221 [Olavius algarvensis associated proteobacterium Delta 3]|nr:hypothetical protein D3OALGB2SA_2788 [Olavius algarvensis associated proteobacterium Delta 3]CAB5130935.1 hypothetical protein D3OALGA1CA_3221 [Olavius algarvensis associated proteobacterium Delta 3]
MSGGLSASGTLQRAWDTNARDDRHARYRAIRIDTSGNDVCPESVNE